MRRYNIDNVYKAFHASRNKDRKAFYLAMQEEISALRGVIAEMAAAESIEDISAIAEKAAGIIHHDIEAEWKARRRELAAKFAASLLAEKLAAQKEDERRAVQAAKDELARIDRQREREKTLRDFVSQHEAKPDENY